MSLIGTIDNNKIEIHPNDTFTTQGTTVVDITGAEIDRSYTKGVFSFSKSKIKKRFGEGPSTTIIDLLRDTEEFSIRGLWSKNRLGSDATSFADVKENMDDAMTIFQGGGTFYITWYGTQHQVILKKVTFKSKKPIHIIEYTLNFLKGVERS